MKKAVDDWIAFFERFEGGTALRCLKCGRDTRDDRDVQAAFYILEKLPEKWGYCMECLRREMRSHGDRRRILNGHESGECKPVDDRIRPSDTV